MWTLHALGRAVRSSIPFMSCRMGTPRACESAGRSQLNPRSIDLQVRRGVLACDAEDDGERRGDERPDDHDDRDRCQTTSAVCLEDEASRTAIRLQPVSRLT
jgi:hypothetical protein